MNTHLSDISGFQNVEEVASRISLSGIPANATFPALANIQTTNYLMLNGNLWATLPDFSALQQLNYLEIQNHPNLITLSGFSALTSLNSVRINHNSQLAELTGLSQLSSVENLMEISFNNQLSRLDIFSLLESTTDQTIIGNSALVGVAFESLEDVSNQLSIGNQPIEQMQFDSLESAGEVHICANIGLEKLDGFRKRETRLFIASYRTQQRPD